DAMARPRPAPVSKMGRRLRMPVPGRQHFPSPFVEPAGIFIQYRNDLVAFRHREGTAFTKVVLHVDDDERFLSSLPAVGLTRRARLLPHRWSLPNPGQIRHDAVTHHAPWIALNIIASPTPMPGGSWPTSRPSSP